MCLKRMKINKRGRVGTFKKYELNFPDCAAMAGKKAVWVNEDCDKELKALCEE